MRSSSSSSSSKTEEDIYGQVHPVETETLIRQKLLEMQVELNKIRPEDKVSVTLAEQKCPELLTDRFKLQFLRCEVFRAKDAAKRFCKYWDSRRTICGSDEKAFQRLTLDRFWDDENKPAFVMGLCQLLPHKDPSGRSILFMDSSRQDWNSGEITVQSQARAASYTLMAALENDTTQQKGIVVVFWPARETWDQPNRKFISLMASAIKGALPVRLSGAHICQPPTFFRMLIPFVNMAMGERLRRRIRFHVGSNEAVQESLAPYGLTQDILPTELGGTVILDHEAWLENRRTEGK